MSKNEKKITDSGRLSEIKFQNAVFFVKNIEKSKDFYTRILGQKISEDYGRYVGFEGGFGIWEAEFALQTIFSESKVDYTVGNTTEIAFESPEVEKIYYQLEKENIKFIHPIKIQPWGQKVFRFYDFDHHIIEIGEPLSIVVIRFYKQGISIENIAKTTNMPLEVIKEIIEQFKFNKE